MYKNKTKEKLKNNQAVFGYICNIPAASISEIAGQANLDFIVIDCKHGPMNEETAENMIRAAEVVGQGSAPGGDRGRDTGRPAGGGALGEFK